MTAPRPTTASFDARPLTDPVEPKAVTAFAADLAARRTPTTAGTVIGAVIAAVVLGLVCLMGFLIAGSVLRGMSGEGAASAGVLLAGIAVIAVGGAGTIGYFAWRAGRIRRYRLGMFARANGMTYVDRIADPGLPGMIFGRGSGRRSTDLVRGTHPRFVEFGNYQYTVKHGKSSTTYRWGYVAVKLDVPLPNIVLDALGNNGFGSNLPASFHPDQRLSLEGDFDRHFTLYCPEGYEPDALYLFTPDIMARFIDHAAELDVEIVDDWMFLYTKRQASTLDPATWAWLFGVVGALLTKLDQWARWRDERLRLEGRSADAAASASPALPFTPPAGLLTPPGVAPQGRRLRRRGTWVPLVVALALMAGWIFTRLT